MSQAHLQQLQELRRRQVEMDAEAARRRRAAVAPTPGAATDPRRGGCARAPGEGIAPGRAAAPLLRCQDCYYFDPVWSAIVGECQANRPPPWGPMHAATWRSCAFFLSNPLGLALQVLADRWQYPEQELASALNRAAIDPASWWRVIDADLEARLWPAPPGGRRNCPSTAH